MHCLERQVGERVVVEISLKAWTGFDSGMRSINAFDNDPSTSMRLQQYVVSNQADDLRDVRQDLPDSKTEVLSIRPCQ
jgi:hypothetical protein